MQVFALVLSALVGADSSGWMTDYGAAIDAAETAKKPLLIAFDAHDKLMETVAGEPAESKLKGYVRLKLPRDHKIKLKGTPVVLLEHEAFADMMSRPGVVIIDYKTKGRCHGCVVSILPIDQMSSAERVGALLDLPEGTLTQRTLIWAMRVHPEAPRSTEGQPHDELMEHAERHSTVQATQNHQHHNMPGIASSEIVAESWPWNKCVVEAALDVVHSWRQSPGHWGAASRFHSFFGYDMKSIGDKWFATGVFID